MDGVRQNWAMRCTVPYRAEGWREEKRGIVKNSSCAIKLLQCGRQILSVTNCKAKNNRDNPANLLKRTLSMKVLLLSTTWPLCLQCGFIHSSDDGSVP